MLNLKSIIVIHICGFLLMLMFKNDSCFTHVPSCILLLFKIKLFFFIEGSLVGVLV